MSVYKVINNYYTDFLNFLGDEKSANKDLPQFFSNITPDKKKMVVSKLSEMMMKFNVAFNNEINYWNSNNKDQRWFLIIYILVLIISAIIIIIFLIFRFKELTAMGTNMFSKAKTSLTHLIIYQIILTIFLVLIVNVKGMKKLCTGQVKLLNEDLKNYSAYIFTGSHRDNMNIFFQFVGLWKKNPKTSMNSPFYKALKNDSSYNDVLKLFTNDPNNATNSSDNTGMPSSSTGIIETQIYDKLKKDIEASLIMFYADGDGYDNIKKMVNLSSPILMLREAKRIMNYYKFLGLKKIQDVSDDPDDKSKAVVYEVVITPVMSLIKDFVASSNDISDTDLSTAVLQNEQDAAFQLEMANLIKAFDYLAIFAYPIYIKVSDKNPDFPLPEILPYMPNKISISNKVDKKTQEFLHDVKIEFGRVYDSEYQNYVNNAKNTIVVDTLLHELFLKLIPLYKELYYRIFLILKGGIWFPFNQKYIVNKIQQSLATGMTSTLPLDYRTNVSSIIFDSIINNIASNFDIIAVKRGFLVESISNSLLSTSINIQKFQTYIINTMLNENKASKNYVDEVKELINQIYRSVLTKKQLKADLEPVDSYKYKELEDFTDLIKTVQYNEFIVGLDVDFYQDIVSKFYANISESVNQRRADLRNIYYTRQTSFNTWKTTIVMVIISLILVLIRYMIEIVEEKSSIFFITPARECDRLFAQRDYRNRLTNWYIKLIVPPFILLFVIALLIATYKKMKATYDFNLDIIETNTNGLKTLLGDFSSKMKEIDDKLDSADKTKTIQLITQITGDDKREMLDLIKKIIDKFDKCNYILESAKSSLPFPYTEVILNGFFMSMAILCMVYVVFYYAPIKRFKDNKYLYKLKEELLVTEDLKLFDQKIQSLGTCHNEDMDAIVFSLKLIVFLFIIMFLVFYSVKILTSANDFKNGLFNSFYYEESMCYGG